MPNVNNYVRLPDGRWEREKNSSSQPSPLDSEELRRTQNLKASSAMKSSSQSFTQPFSQPEELSGRPLKIISGKELMEQETNGVESLWGNFLYEKSIVLLAGEAGVGKTTLAYNLAIYGAKGESFCDIPFQKPLNILYCDLETGDDLRKNKAMIISDNDIPSNLYFNSELDFIGQLNRLIKLVKEKAIDLVIIDTINEAFNTRDEQDNAEANRQFRSIKKLRDEGECCVLLMHHTGKGEQPKGVYSARGASARAGSVDVVLTLKANTEDTICIQKEKDRIAGGKERLYLRKVGEDAFEVIEQGEEQEAPLVIRAQRFIKDLLNKGIYTRTEFVEQGQSQGFSRATIDRATTNLIKAAEIVRPKRGIYSRVSNPIREDPRVVGEHCSPHLKAYSENNRVIEKNDSLEKMLGMTIEEAIKVWKSEGAPVIHLEFGENCLDLAKLLSNSPGARHLEIVAQWLKEHSPQ